MSFNGLFATSHDARESFTKSVILKFRNERKEASVKSTEDQLWQNCIQARENYDTVKEIQTEWKINIPAVTRTAKYEGKYGVSTTEEVPVVCLEENGESLPPMRVWVPINRNVLVEDETVLSHVPYLGDEAINVAQQSSNSAQKHNTACHPHNPFIKMPHWGRPFSDDAIVELVDRLTDLSNFENFYAELVGEQSIDIKNIPLEIITKEDAFKLISEQFPKEKMTPAIIREIYYAHMATLQKTDENMSNFDSEWDNEYSAEQAMHTFETLFCPRCFLYECDAHPPFKVKYRPQEVDLDYYEPCGKDCFLNIETVRPENYLLKQNKPTEYPKISPMNIKTDHWTSQDKTLFNVCVRPFQLNFCRIARTFIGKICSEVYIYWESLDEQTKSDHMEMLKGDKNELMMNTKKSKNGKKSNFWKKHAEKVGEKLAIHYRPCEHDGQCGTDVPGDCCVKRGTFCEKFCNCILTCDNRFPGCACKGACNSNHCSCYKASRECDPDLCKDCGAAELNLLQQRDKYKCTNVSIQRNLCKHLLLGRSQVSGWGIFLKGTAKKGDFISEYRGEVISQAEADQRGAVYDQKKISYLFNLNDEQCIDATFRGSKVRFANHSKSPNCISKVKMVNGDFRIGIYANQNIEDGEELFIDYRYRKEHSLNFVPIERPNQNRK